MASGHSADWGCVVGFWKDLGDYLKDAAVEYGKNPQSWYVMGKNEASSGMPRRSFEFEAQRVPPNLIRAYERGYDEGRNER
jgi:hypothetical protein